MIKKFTLALLFLILFTKHSDAQTRNNLKDINATWQKFYQAFETLDYTLMAQIHSKALIRISNGQNILDYNTYISNYKKRFKDAKKNNSTNNISLRFFERINNDSIASERGIYKLIVHEDKSNEKAYYGQFHVILKKEVGQWKITLDYDSSEFNTIGANDYAKAHGIEALDVFVKN
ncbi:hypothetical protein N7U66_13405 [Lacinutrix neustonica]|uniref:DUF4440 domain-containing protein n=1 Tax=Lacinutrix neustonica TaxID=2980107 RepID=A0A9E8MTE5_9FLAO|nr:hypothetical protein [Lacinutrix neustonica]WAC01147.1 hypothetical protein N7U66_13405 [Lacinutrix neustonica]